MSVTNRFPLWGKLGESPIDGFEYDGGDQVNEKHLNFLWDKIQKQTDDFIDKTDSLQTQLDGHEAATEAHGSNGAIIGEITFNDHSSRHEAGGADQLNVTGLSGDLADAQDAKAHASSHGGAGSDTIDVENLGTTGPAQTVPVSQGDGTLSMQEGAIPPGVITMWSGAITDIPNGWTLCDGSNGAPDLRNRFITGAGGQYTVGSTGGQDEVQLTIDEMPSHNHTYDHPIQGSDNEDTSGGNNGSPRSTSTEGGDQAHENRPPYHALAYIMKE